MSLKEPQVQACTLKGPGWLGKVRLITALTSPCLGSLGLVTVCAAFKVTSLGIISR